MGKIQPTYYTLLFSPFDDSYSKTMFTCENSRLANTLVRISNGSIALYFTELHVINNVTEEFSLLVYLCTAFLCNLYSRSFMFSLHSIKIDLINSSTSSKTFLYTLTVMKYTPEEAINFTKKSVALLVSWPPPVNTSKTKLFLIDVYFYTSFVITTLSMAVLINGMYTYRNNLEVIIQCTCTALVIIQMGVKMMACKTKRSDLQTIITEMENVLQQAKPYERAILKKYVNRCAFLHMALTFAFYLGSVGIILGPIVLPQPLPTFAIYPFSVDYHPVYEIVYFQQAFTALQAAAAAAIDCQVASLLWFAAARFEMLKFELTNVLDDFDLRRCILKHQRILRYAKNVTKNVSLVILATVGVTAMLMVFSGILFLFVSISIYESMMIKFQFSVVVAVSIIQLFLNSYPAENLIEMSYEVGSAAYNSDWINKSHKMWTGICTIIQRSQRPVKVSVGGFLPSLSLSYYMSFLTSSFSYFTTMRATVQ